MKQTLIQFYLDYLNDWLTVEAYSAYNGLSVDATRELVNLGRDLHIDNTEVKL